jgi:hypothetical protein
MSKGVNYVKRKTNIKISKSYLYSILLNLKTNL